MNRLLLLLAIVLALPVQAQVALESALGGAAFARPTDLRHDAEGRLYLAEQQGIVRVFEDDAYAGVFLDIRDLVGEEDLEGGLLSFAFHPDYAANGFVFAHYYAVQPRRSVIARFSRDPANPLRADPASERILLEVAQPLFNHNGGAISFGADGLLYIALGDGGCCSDVFGNAQNLTTLLGSVLRIDVDDPDAGLNYGIPADNPFAASGGPERPEIYAWGFRSPWRIAHDPATGDLWLGDVGQDRYEDVSRIERGGNYGWPIMEAAHCFEPMVGCDTEGLTLPVWEYGRDEGRSVTGGYVYRGAALPSLVGKYVYGDYVSGRIWALEIDTVTGDTTNTELLDTDLLVASFGVDAAGELYVLSLLGEVYRLVPDAAIDLSATATSPLTVAPGGSVSFAYAVSNRSGSVATGDLFFEATQNGATVASGIVASGTLADGRTVGGSFVQRVPANAPPGSYLYTLNVGAFPGTAVDTERFTVTVEANGNARATAHDEPSTTWSVVEATRWHAVTSMASRAVDEPMATAFPNPFARQTEIAFALDRQAEVRLAVYDVRGREVARLADGTREAGRHAVAFDAAGLPSGVYVWRLVAEGRVETGRITLLR